MVRKTQRINRRELKKMRDIKSIKKNQSKEAKLEKEEFCVIWSTQQFLVPGILFAKTKPMSQFKAYN